MDVTDMDVDGILFDKDGTLFDFRRTWSSWTSDAIEYLCRNNLAKKELIAEALGYDPKNQTFLKSSLKYDFLKKGKKIILIREETSPEDIHGMHYSEGILTSRGGLTSHAALVARGWGKSCIVGCQDLTIDKKHRFAKIGDNKIREGDLITLNGSSGDTVSYTHLTLPTNREV